MKAREIAEFVNGVLIGDGEVEVTSVADLSSGSMGQAVFFDRPEKLPPTGASVVFVTSETAAAASTEPGLVMITTAEPKLAFARFAASLESGENETGVHESASIAEGSDVRASFVGAFVSIGNGSVVGEGSDIRDGVRIGSGVTIGKRTTLHPNVVIYDNVDIGDDCVIHAGVVIGADGFGYVRDNAGEYVKFPQIGTVVIENNVEIGANSCIDRGALAETRVGEGTKIDNLVQVGHNVRIGKRCVIAAQTGISGSVTIEDDCVIGGQVGFGDHVTVKSGAVIGSQAGVLPGKIVRPGVWWGTPIQPLDEYKRQNARVKGLDRLKRDVEELKKKYSDG